MKAQFLDSERREVAMRAERLSNARIALPQVWQELTRGQTQVVDSFVDDERCYFVLAPLPSGEQGAGLTERRRSILENLLCGKSIKAMAFDLHLSQSTVSQEAKAAMQQLGLQCSPCRANPLLAMLARASVDRLFNRCARIACFSVAERMFRIIGAARPEAGLSPLLSPAELAVVRGLLEGRNYLEIAAYRGTSTRTVANQLAAAFRRLGVSGRGSLLNHLVCAGDSLGSNSELRVRA